MSYTRNISQTVGAGFIAAAGVLSTMWGIDQYFGSKYLKRDRVEAARMKTGNW